MRIAKNTLVAIHYTLKDSDGIEIDSSVGKEPLEYIHGNNMLIPGLEVMLEGKEPGLKFKAVVEPEEAYGTYNEKLVVKIPKSQFETEIPIQVGMPFYAQTEDGQNVTVRVVNVDDDFITVDGNHELAGKQLTFDIEIISVREATEEDFAALNNSCCGGGCGNCGGDCSGGSCGGGCGGGCSCN